MKKIFNYIKFVVVIFYLVIANSFAQEAEKIIGTMGNEKMGSDKIVICVYGTAACMPVNIDTAMTVKFQSKETKLTELPFGLYLEIKTTKDKNGTQAIKNIVIDENKTVICLTELKEGQDKKLNELLTNLKGVNSYELNTNSNQIFIEFSSKVIAYKDLENRIKEAGFELE